MNKRIAKVAQYYFVCFIVFHVLRWVNGLTLTQLAKPYIYLPRLDPLLWIYQILGFSHQLTQNLNLIFDLGIPLYAAYLLYRVRKNKPIHWQSLVFGISFGIYLLAIFSYPSLSIRKYLGLAVIPLLFVFNKERAVWTWEVLRYYVLFIFSSSALWKIIRGSFGHDGQMESILKGQHAVNLIHFPDAWVSQFGTYLLNHSAILDPLFTVATLFQLSFLIGFFTKKWDKYIALLLVLFVVADYFIMWIEYWEFFIFLPLLWWSKSSDRTIYNEAIN